MAEQILNQEDAGKERIYREAAQLQDAADCVLRFERKVAALRSAAKKFRSVSEYKDAAECAQECLRQADILEKEGLEETFALGIEKEQASKTKSDYLDAITEYKRVWKKEHYAGEAREHIKACKEEILRIETRAIRKKRLIFLAVVAALLIIFVNTDAYPFTKGMVHQAMGDYRASIADFKAGMGVPWAKGKMKKSYFYLGKQYLESGDKEAALKAFWKADGVLESPEETAKLEQEFLAEAELGDEVRFGKGKWLVLEKKKKMMLLVYQKAGTRMVYSQEETLRWEDTKIYQWLNKEFVGSVFTEAERDISHAEAHGGNREEYATLLTVAQREKYKKLLGEYNHNWWLKDTGLSAMGASYVDKEGNVKQTYVNCMVNCARPAVWVKVK